jgi:hypothetical protein
MEQGYGPGDIKEDEQHPWYVKYGLRALATAAGGCELFICNLSNNDIMLEKCIIMGLSKGWNFSILCWGNVIINNY